VGSSWLPLVFSLGQFVGGVLLLGVIGLLVIWLTLHVSPPWLFLSRHAWQHDWRGDGFPTLGEERNERGMKSEEEDKRRGSKE